MLTDKELKALKPKQKIYEVAHHEGLSVRVHPTGELTFQYRYRINGRPERFRIGRYPELSLADAKRELQKARELVEQRVSPVELQRAETAKQAAERLSNAGADSVRALADEFMAREIEKKFKRPENVRQMLYGSTTWKLGVLEDLGTMRAKNVTEADVVRALDKIVDRGASVLANRTLLVLRRMFHYGKRRGFCSINPCADIRRGDIGGREMDRDRALSPDEVGILWRKLSELADTSPGAKRPKKWIGVPMATALQILLVSGQRRGELVKAEWSDVDLDDGVWTIPAKNAKNGRAHRVMLSSLAVSLFERLKTLAPASKFVLPSPMADKDEKPVTERKVDKPITERALSKAAHRAQEFIGVAKWTPHDLRRTAATRMGDIGILPHIVEKILGHTMQGVMAVYNRNDYPNEQRDALIKWADRIELLARKEPKVRVLKALAA
jgi:integrase